MSDLDQTAPVAEVSNTATEPTNEPAEVVTPQATEQAEPQASEKDERDKAIARMERRINRKHAEAAAANERVRMLEERLQSIEKAQPAPEKVEIDPRQLENTVQERAKQIARIERLDEQCDAVAAKGKAKFEDFEDAMDVVRAEIPLFDSQGATPALMAVLEADDPSALLHYLGKHPDVLSELAELTPTQMARRFDRIERELASPPKTSAAPKPIEPVAGRATATLSYSPEMSDAQFAKWRKAQRANS